jgi:hypothetical protein
LFRPTEQYPVSSTLANYLAGFGVNHGGSPMNKFANHGIPITDKEFVGPDIINDYVSDLGSKYK